MGARRNCEENNKTSHSMRDTAGCASNITDILTQLAWVASFLSLVPSWCGQRDLAHQACAADWALITADPLQALTDILATINDCDNASAPDPTPIRRLQTEDTTTRKI